MLFYTLSCTYVYCLQNISHIHLRIIDENCIAIAHDLGGATVLIKIA